MNKRAKTPSTQLNKGRQEFNTRMEENITFINIVIVEKDFKRESNIGHNFQFITAI